MAGRPCIAEVAYSKDLDRVYLKGLKRYSAVYIYDCEDKTAFDTVVLIEQRMSLVQDGGHVFLLCGNKSSWYFMELYARIAELGLGFNFYNGQWLALQCPLA